jgi:hypothetical protein
MTEVCLEVLSFVCVFRCISDTISNEICRAMSQTDTDEESDVHA